MKDKLTVETRFGTLVAEINNDPSFPAVWVSLIPKSKNFEITLATVESTYDDTEEGELRTVVWACEGEDEPSDFINHELMSDEQRREIYGDS